MKYSNLFNFQPIDRIIVLTESKDEKVELERVKSYVMSDDMADKLNAHLISQLSIDEVVDNRGMLLVGNYGTGKSHLMSLISAIARDAKYLSALQNKKFAEYCNGIAGKFEILRIEIGAVSTQLRDIILNKISDDFKDRGIDIKIPNDNEISNNKGTLKEIMSEFNKKYPGKGYFVVVDELLDYLGGRNHQEIMRDLGFMRELGEFSKESRFRIIFGLQEKMFDNPKFSFVTDTMKRIKDRYEQIIIHKNDTAYVVSQRILGKNDEQRDIIRRHLLKFSNLYSNMYEHIEEYIDLYPIHPEYISVFDKILTAENRHILESICNIVQQIKDDDFREDVPGIISYDSYWEYIKDNQMNRTDPTLKDVIDKSATLEDIISHNFPKNKEIYKPLAIKIIHALSVHRLTTNGDTSIPTGLTSENLKDDLCLFLNNLPDQTSETLNSVVQVTLNDITKTVSGQFIEQNVENGQYYLDLKKDIDYDEKIRNRADLIDDNSLNEDYFDIIFGMLNWDVTEYVKDFKIYQHSINWKSHNVFRRGYLFFGTPNQRPTAQPPRDYYVYFTPPYGPEQFVDDKRIDEVFFDFQSNDDFKNKLKLYSAALTLKGYAEEKNKPVYKAKADNYRKELTRLLSDNRTSFFKVTYRGQSKRILDILKGYYRDEYTFKELIELSSSIELDDFFEQKYPNYPFFKSPITSNNMDQYIEGAISILAGKKNSMDALLDGFGLLIDNKIKVDRSKYAQYIANKIAQLRPDAVINFNDIFIENSDEFVDKEFKINYKLMSVVLLSLVLSGHLQIKLRNGQTITAAGQESFTKIDLEDLSQFAYLSRPKEVQLRELTHLFEILDLPTAWIQNPANHEMALDKMLEKTTKLSEMAAICQSFIDDSKKLWGEPVIPEHIIEDYRGSCKNINEIFGNFSRRFDKPSKLSNFTYSIEDIDNFAKDINIVEIVNEYSQFYTKCVSETTYVETIEINLPEHSSFRSKIAQTKIKFREIRDNIPSTKNGEFSGSSVKTLLSAIKKEYIDLYCQEHAKKRLSFDETKKKGEIIESIEFKNLKRLKDIINLPVSRITDIETELSKLWSCPDFTSASISSVPICNNCKLHLDSDEIDVEGRLDSIRDSIEVLLIDFTNSILKTLSDPIVSDQIQYLDAEKQEIIESFINSKKLPAVVDSNFTNAINSLMSGFIPIKINLVDFANELDKLGPCDLESFNNAVTCYINELIKGKDRNKVRLLLKRE